MPTLRARAALRALLCMIVLAASGPLFPATPAFAQAPSASIERVRQAPETAESCGRGKTTKDFGWRVVEFGVSTLKYLVGLFIIPVGLFLVVIGWMLQAVEAVTC